MREFLYYYLLRESRFGGIMLDSIRLKARMEVITYALKALILFVIAGAVFFGLLSSYFFAKFQAPTPIDASNLDAGFEKPLYFASASGETFDTGYYWTHDIATSRRGTPVIPTSATRPACRTPPRKNSA